MDERPRANSFQGLEQKSVVSSGICLQLPEGTYGKISPRPGLAHKHGIDVLAGVVDKGYTGEVKVILYNAGKEAKTFSTGKMQ